MARKRKKRYYQEGGPVQGDRLQELMDLARQRREQQEEDIGGIDASQLAEGALEGATYGAAALPVLGEVARRLPREEVLPRAGEGIDVLKQRGRVTRARPRSPRGAVASAITDIAQSALKRPKSAAAAEIAGGAGAGAAIELAREGQFPEEYETLAETGAGIAGGMAAGTLPVAATNLGRRLARWGMDNAVPVIGNLPVIRRIPGVQRAHQASAEARAARQMQARSSDPEEAARLAAEGREGVSPARRTGEERLLAQEARIREDDPVLDRMFREDLESAARAAQGDLASLYATRQGRQDWERAIMQRVAGTADEIPTGSTEEMLDAAYKSYETAYEPVRGFPIRPHLMRTGRSTQLETMLSNVAQSARADATDATREQVGRQIRNQFTTFKRRLQDGLVQSEDMLRLRSRFRELARESRRGGGSDDRARAQLYEIAAEKVTDVLRSQLDPSVLRHLSAVDQQYRHYKTIEDAVFRAGGKPLTPDQLLQAVRRAAPSRGGLARGAAREMQDLAHRGREVSEFMNKPQIAGRVARGMSEPEREALKGDFVRELMRRAERVDEDGLGLVSGQRLQTLLNQHRKTATAIGMDSAEIDRLRTMATEIRNIQAKSPQAVERIIEDGPSSVLELLGVLTSVHGGHRMGRGTGASQMVLSGFLAKRARALLDLATSDLAADIIIDAHQDPKLFSALMTKSTDPRKQQLEAARTLNAYLGYAASNENVYDDLGLRELREDAGALLGE